MKKKWKRIMAVVFGLTLLCGSAFATSAHADVAEPCEIHTYDYDCDTICNICGYERSASHTYNLYGQNYYYHWLMCECGAKLEINAHKYDNDTDLTCAECGYERHLEHSYTIPGADNTYHWDECSCGEKINKEVHTLTPKADGTWHWEECACGTKVNIGAHVWGAGVTNGEITVYTCTICGTQKTVNTQGGDNTGDNTGEDGENPGDGTGDNTGDNNNPGEGNQGDDGQGGDNAGDVTGDNTGSGDSSGDNAGNNSGNKDGDDDSKNTKGGNFGKWLFGGIGAAVVLWGGAIGGYLIYQKKKGSDKDSVKESKENV